MCQPFRCALLGDSWVCDWVEGADGWEMRAPFADALQKGFACRAQDAEFIVAGFPGGTTSAILNLAKICRLRDMAVLSKTGRSIKRNLVGTLDDLGIPHLTIEDDTTTTGRSRNTGTSRDRSRSRSASRPTITQVCEDLDVVIMVVGVNDIANSTEGFEVAGNLFKLREMYRERGAKVFLVSVGGMGPGAAEDLKWFEAFEAHRKCTNAWLLAQEGVINVDKLVQGVDASHWENAWHLTSEGAAIVGRCLAALVNECLDAPDKPPPGVSNPELHTLSPAGMGASGDALPVLEASGCKSVIVSNIIKGYYIQNGDHHGRPMYKKQAGPGEPEVLLFYWDDRNGAFWVGWCFGPTIGWEDPGWAHHGDGDALTPPLAGWKIPWNGPVDETLHLTLRSELHKDQKGSSD